MKTPFSRRKFLHQSVLATSAGLAAPLWLSRAGAADTEKVTAALAKTNYNGVMGPFTFTPHRDPASTEGVVVLEMQGGKFGIAK